MKKFLPILILLALPGLFHSCAAQKPADYGIKSKKALDFFLRGKQQQEYRDHKKALEFFQAALEEEPTFGEALFNAGACNYSMHKYEEARPYLEKAIEVWQDPHPLVFFYLAEVFFNQDKYKEADEQYTKFFAAKPQAHINLINGARKHHENAKFGVMAMQKPVTFNPVNLGQNINTPYDEYLPYLTADEGTIFLTARRPESTGGYSPEYRDFTEDFFFSEKKNNEWQPAKNLGPPVNTDMNEGAACFSPDGQWVYFTACSRKGGFGDCDIYASKLEGGKWSEPKNLGPLVNTDSWESQPCISHDGNILYFASTRPGGLGGSDIWFVERVKGAWTQAKNLGAPVNTAGTEYSPFLHADGSTLYFSSDGHPGMGNLDLFMSRKVDGKFTMPENLGYPLNTSGFEGNLFINSAGTMGYMNSTRQGGLGKSDLYSFELDERIQPSYTTYVRGFVKEEDSNNPLSAKVTFINIETRDTIRAVQTNSATGKFLLTLPVDQDYAAFVETPGYLFASRNFSLKGLPKNKNTYYDLEILLDKIDTGEVMVLPNIFYATGRFDLLDESKAELDNLVRFLAKNPSVKIEIGGHTDDVGTDKDNQVLSENRSTEVKKYLESHGIKTGRITAVGYGEKRPLCKTLDEPCRAQNRRTEMRILEK